MVAACHHSIGVEHGTPPDGIVVEGHVGGVIYETLGDDRRTWGTIVEWEPPSGCPSSGR